MQQYIGFKLGGNEFTIPILKVREIINTPAITQLPGTPHYMKGIINLRGRIVAIFDLKELVSMRGAAGGGGGKVIVVANAQNVFGVLVDSITSVINIDESDIEPAGSIMSESLDRVEGVARFDDRLVILLDTDKLVDSGEMRSMSTELDSLEANAMGLEESAPTRRKPAQAKPAHAAKAPRRPAQEGPAEEIQTGLPPAVDAPYDDALGGATVHDIHEVRDILSRKFNVDDGRNRFLVALVDLMDSMASRDFDRSEKLINEMMRAGSKEGHLFKEIGTVTRKLHDSLKNFRSSLDPRIRRIADEDVPQAVDSLEFVIRKTEDAANRTMAIVEKYYSGLSEFEAQMNSISSPEQFIAYLNDFRESLREDLNEILVAQEFQDITGQTIRRVIELVNAIEVELVNLISTFGVKTDEDSKEKASGSQKLSQDDVEDLLKEFGF